MKKFLILIVCLFSFVTISNAQVVNWFKATSFSYRYVDDYGYWTNWSKWEECNIRIQFLYSKDVIIIYSNKTQNYKIINMVEPPYDPNGVTVKYQVYDSDGDYGYIRLRVEDNGNSQIYVDFNNISWVYNVYKLR
jgi:hypothetical protein